MSGEKNLNNEKKAQAFLQKVDDWIEDRNVDLIAKNDQVENIINLPSGEINNMKQHVAAAYSFVLFAHAEYIQTLYNKEKSVVDFCENSIWYIISDKVNNYGGQYSKWQEKYYSAIKENPLAKTLNNLKLHSEARLSRLTNKSELTKKMATILYDISKRRNNEYY